MKLKEENGKDTYNVGGEGCEEEHCEVFKDVLPINLWSARVFRFIGERRSEEVVREGSNIY